jgi:hypothetical protein
VSEAASWQSILASPRIRTKTANSCLLVRPHISRHPVGKSLTPELRSTIEMASVARTCRLIPFEHIVYRATPEGGMLVDLQTAACFGLNQVGAHVWARLAAGDTVATTIEAIRRMYALQADVAESDVTKICEEVLRAGLVTCSDDERR